MSGKKLTGRVDLKVTYYEVPLIAPIYHVRSLTLDEAIQEDFARHRKERLARERERLARKSRQRVIDGLLADAVGEISRHD
jgi:hypothetical protein